MDQQAFDQRVFELEAKARSNPKRYQNRLLLLALLGNAYLALVFLLVLGILIATLLSVKVLGALAGKFILVLGVFIYMMVRALWVKIPKPQGFEVKPGDVPELFAMIDELCKALQAPRFHSVLITDDFNAGVVQTPRLGIFGWHRNYLLIGLPLMKSLTVEQFKAVLAHEFGHLAKGHGCLSNWLYRQRLRWMRLMSTLESTQSSGRWLFSAFLKWYWPNFNAYSFPLARANEYDADAASVRLTSAKAAAEALTNVDVTGSFLSERFWPGVFRQANDIPSPTFTPYTNMGEHFSTEMAEVDCQNWLKLALNRRTNSQDTHPALADRLKAIGEKARIALPPPNTSADRLLGDALPRLAEAFDQSWQSNVKSVWEDRHREVQENRFRLQELDDQVAAGVELHLNDAYDRARLTSVIKEDQTAAIEQLRSLLQSHPDNSVLLYHLGTCLLSTEDETGVACLNRAMELDELCTPSACEALRDYAWRQGREEEAKAWHERSSSSAQIKQEAEAERNQITPKDQFIEHELAPEQMEHLLGYMREIGGLRQAYLVKKTVKQLPHRPCYVFGFTLFSWFQFYNRGKVLEAIRRIQQMPGFPGETLIICLESDNAQFLRKFRRVKNSRIL